MSVTITSGVERWRGDLRISDFYRPFPRQEVFHTSPAKYRLFGGAAGPGKSKALLMEAIVQAHEVERADTLLLRKTFPELEGSLLLYLRRDVPRELWQSFNESKRVVTWRNGSTTRFGYCERDNDVYQYQGNELLFVGLDELTHFTLRQWQFLTSRNRCPVPGSFPNMAGATNPGNIGHAWAKALFIDKKPASGMDAREYDAREYEFIPARLADNPIYANDQNYLKSLAHLPDAWKRAFLDGDWNVFAGQYFTNFELGRHTPRAEDIGIEPWWPHWSSIDWGFAHHSAAYWHATQPKTKDMARRTVTYREFVTEQMGPRKLGAEIVSRSVGRDGKPERAPVAVYLSPDAFAHRTDETSIAEQLGDVFASAGWPRPTPADNDRIGGWMLLHELLDANEWVIADSCPELIKVLPTLTRDPSHVEDVLKMEDDDPADAARYGLKSHLRKKNAQAPLEQRVAERVTSSDLTLRAIQAKKAFADESAKTAGQMQFTKRRWRPGMRRPKQGA